MLKNRVNTTIQILLSLLLTGCVTDNQVRIAQAQAVIEQAKAAQDAAQAAQIAASGLAGAAVGQTILIALLVIALLAALVAIVWLLLRQNNAEVTAAPTAAQLTGQQGAWLPGPNANWQRRMKPADIQNMLLLQLLQQQLAQHPQQPAATLPAPTESAAPQQDLWSQL